MKSIILMFMLVVPTSISYSQITKDKTMNNQELAPSIPENNKLQIRKLYEEALNKRRWNLLDTLIADDYVGLNGQKGAAAFSKNIQELISSFPDIHWTLGMLIAEGDQVMLVQQVEGTQLGSFQQLPPTGKKIHTDGIAIYQLKDGKITSGEVRTDRLGTLQQLGFIPTDLSIFFPTASQSVVSLIDRFVVPKKSIGVFMERMAYNRSIIHDLSGFLDDEVFEKKDRLGNLHITTIARWKNQDDLNKAKQAVQAAYQKINFNMPEFLEQLHIKLDRRIYRELAN